MKKLSVLVFTAMIGLALVMPATADTSGFGNNQPVIQNGGNSGQKQAKKGHRHGKKQHKKKAVTTATLQK